MLLSSLVYDLNAQVETLSREALDAQSLLFGSDSLAIPNNQWKAEVQQMFETLLARTQITARYIARGDPAQQLPGHTLFGGPGWEGMCTLYKFKSLGWKNISVAGFLGEFLVGVLVFFVGITREDEELWIERPVRSLVKSRIGRLCADGWNKMGERWGEYAPIVGSWMCSAAGGFWWAACGGVKLCWQGVVAIWTWLYSLSTKQSRVGA